MKNANFWIRKLKLKKHPEGGYYRETYRSDETIPTTALPTRYKGKRAFSTSILFLLKGKEVSRLHRLKSDETWHFYAGSPLTMHVIAPNGKYSAIKLGPAPDLNQSFQYTIKRNHWFGATVDNPAGFSLVACTVSPGFDFADFELGSRRKLLTAFPRHRTMIIKLS